MVLQKKPPKITHKNVFRLAGSDCLGFQQIWYLWKASDSVITNIQKFQVSTLPRLIQWAIQRNLDQDSWAIGDQGWRARSVVTIFEISRRCKNGGRTQDFHCREIFESSSLLKVGSFLL